MSGGGESQPIGHAPGGDGMPLFHAGPVRAFDDEEMKTWVTVYPAYIDSTLKLSAGRKISKEDGVEAPHPAEIMEVLKRLKLTFYIENKKYPKQWWVNGRFRVRLKTEDGFAKDPQTKEEYKTSTCLSVWGDAFIVCMRVCVCCVCDACLCGPP